VALAASSLWLFCIRQVAIRLRQGLRRSRHHPEVRSLLCGCPSQAPWTRGTGTADRARVASWSCGAFCGP